MGTLGVEPFENDASMDWLEETSDIIKKRIRKLLFSMRGRLKISDYDYNEKIRAASSYYMIAFKNGLVTIDGSAEILSIIIERLNEILNDKEWIDSWGSQDSIKLEINNNIKEAKSLCRRIARSRLGEK